MKCVIHDEYEVDFDETPKVEEIDVSLFKAIQTLTPKQFGMLELRYNQKLSKTEICDSLNIDEKEYTKRLANMKKELKKYFGVVEKIKNDK